MGVVGRGVEGLEEPNTRRKKPGFPLEESVEGCGRIKLEDDAEPSTCADGCREERSVPSRPEEDSLVERQESLFFALTLLRAHPLTREHARCSSQSSHFATRADLRLEVFIGRGTF